MDSKYVAGFNNILFENDFKLMVPEIFLIFSTIFLLLYGVIYSTSYYPKPYPLLLRPISWLSVLCLIFTALLLINSPINSGVIFYNTLVADDFTLFFKFLVVVSSASAIIIALDYVDTESFKAFEYSILILLATTSMMFLIASADFISMYLAIELQSLCFYVLAAFKRNSVFSTESGLKYFVLGAFSSGILLFGISLIYGFTGITNFSEIFKLFTCGIENFNFGLTSQTLATDVSALKACELGMIFILVGLLFKMTAVPFHMWAPDVYEGAPTSITAFFSISPKISILAILLRVFSETFYDFMLPWQKLLIFCSIASMLLGAFAALSQNKIKRLLAFSSIGHVGYLLIGICCGTVEGLQALFIYLFIYIIMTICLFAITLSPVKKLYLKSSLTHLTLSDSSVKYITDFALLGKNNPILALTLTIALFSIAGIPPLAGFYSKAFLFFAGLSSSMYLLAIVGVLTSVVSCFYYIRLIKIMYFEGLGKTGWCVFSRISKENSYVLGITVFLMLFFIAYPSPLYLITHKVALCLCS